MLETYCRSTRDVEPHRALEYWVTAVREGLLELDIDSPVERCFSGALRVAPFGPASLVEIDASAQRLFRTRAAIARGDRPVFTLLYLREGAFRLDQRGRGATVRAGQCVLSDSARLAEIRCPEATRALTLQIPDRWLRNFIPSPEDLVALPIAASVGWAAALVAAMAALDFGTLDQLTLPPGMVLEQIVSLLTLAVGPSLGQTAGRDKLQHRVIRTLTDRCHESDLSPTSVALEHRISRRYLHMLFARQATTFGRELLRVRLDRAKALIADHRFKDVPIGEIAGRCGFLDASHFARRFRQRFGMAPSACRREGISRT